MDLTRQRSLLMGLFVLLLCPVWAQGPAKRVVVFTPTTQGNTYWPQVYEVLRGAARDLGVDLLFYEFDVRDRYAKQDDGVRILRGLERVDGAIFSVAFGQTLPLLEVTEARGIPVMVQGPLFQEELLELGGAPRERYESWIGIFREDEFSKGRELGRVLIQTAINSGMTAADGTVRVVGIGGDSSWYGSELRAEGLRAAVAEYEQAKLMQVVPTFWTEAEGGM